MNTIQKLRTVGIVEGASFLLLLFIAMPLKYVFQMPLAVRIVGAAHGVLFLWFLWLLLRAHLERDWSLLISAKLFLASLLPFGFVWLARDLRRELTNE